MADLPMDPHIEAVDSLRRDTNEQFVSFRRDTNEQFDSFRREINGRFERVDQRFERLERRVDLLERRMEDGFTGLRILIESVRDDVRLVLEHLSPTMTRVADHERRITALEQRRRKPS